MRYGIVTANLGEYADPRVAIRLARAAEAAGWEAFFVWGHNLGFVWGVPSGDPWVVLSAVAASTKRLKLGLAVTPLARRRPQVVANALASLDLLSGKRIAFGAGLGGAPDEFSAFGEPADAKQRAARWDGWLAPATSHDGTPTMAKSPERIAEIRRHRTTEAPFEVAVDGYSEPGDPRLPRSYGATWWLESIHNVRGPQGEMMARVKAGPPEAE